MQKHQQQKLNPKKVLTLDSNLWFWAIFAGFFFSLGYSITRNVYLSKNHRETAINELHEKKAFLGPKNLFPEENHKKLNVLNKNGSSKDKKIIFSPSKKDLNLRLEIHYSEVQNLKNQAIFKNNHNFFAKETVKSLIKTLRNTKITKSSKVETD